MAKILLAIAILAAVIVALRFLPIADWLQAFQSWVRGQGAAGYLLYVLVYVICCVLIIPASILTLGAGAIFGFAAGSVVVMVGATLGACAAFLLGRTVLRERVRSFVESRPRLSAVDQAIAREGTKIMLLMRLSGFPPFTWVNYALGLTGVRFVTYAWTTLFGMIPGVLAFVYAGAAGAAAATGSGNRLALIVTAVGAVLVSIYVARIATRAIQRAGIQAGP